MERPRPGVQLAGNPVGSEFAVNTQTAGHQEAQMVIALPSGGFAIAWQDEFGDGSGYAVKARLFDATGTPTSDEILLNSITTGNQNWPFLLATDAGFAALWSNSSGLTGTPAATKSYLSFFTFDSNVINGTEGDDTLVGTAGEDVINGLGGNDSLFGLQSDDVLDGGDGDDQLSGNQGNDTLYGRAGSDLLNGNPGDDTLDGGDGDDRVVGGPGNDTLYGGSGHDFLRGDNADGLIPGDDYIDGGAGFDRATYYNLNNGVTVSLLLQGAPQDTGQGWDTLINVEAISGSVFSDVLTGDDNDNWFTTGGAGLDGHTVTTDTITANGGNDLIIAGFGNHILDGGSGTDTVGFAWIGNEVLGGITVSLGLQGAPQDTGQGSMTLSGFENLSGSGFDDVLIGDSGANLLAGNAGNDVLTGGEGNDVLLGDGEVNMSPSNAGPATVFDERDYAGVDFYDSDGNMVFLFEGQDLYDANGNQLPRTDLVDEFGDPYSQFVVNGITYDFYALVGSPAISDGVVGNDILDGGDGDDTLIGGAGNNSLIGGAGNDSIDGGGGTDTLFYNTAAGPVDLDLQAGLAVEYAADEVTYLSTDTLVSIEYVVGSNFSDALVGSNDDNYFDGMDGDDLIVGMGGDDQIFGSAGNDLLRGDGFNNYLGPSGNDTIFGGDGNDVMWTSGGVNSYDGGDGFDRVSFFTLAATQAAVASLVTQTISNDGFGNAETMTSIEALGAGTAFADHLTGDDNDNFLLGDYSDTLIGNGGNDSFQLSGAPALLDGGAGNRHDHAHHRRHLRLNQARQQC